MDNKKFESNKQIVDKYSKLLLVLPGLQCVSWNDEEIILSIHPDMIDLVKGFVATKLDGTPIRIKPRSNPPTF